jgi:hypothetical protein
VHEVREHQSGAEEKDCQEPAMTKVKIFERRNV